MLTSPPELKFFPAPDTTTTPISGSPATAMNALTRLSIVSKRNAFRTLGRLIVIRATPSFFSNRMSWNTKVSLMRIRRIDLYFPRELVRVEDRIHRGPRGKAISDAVQLLHFSFQRGIQFIVRPVPRCDDHGVDPLDRVFLSGERIPDGHVPSIIFRHDRVRGELHAGGI